MKQTKTFKVIMLSTKKASRLWLRGSDSKLILENDLQYNSTTVKGCQHLYIISDDQIKEGDWFINMTNSKPYSCDNTNNKMVVGYTHLKKIIATTDQSLQCTQDRFIKGYIAQLPKLPESFIQAYIKAYNEGKPITEVDLEYENTVATNPNIEYDYYGLVLRPNNTVIVHQSKMYSRTDMQNAFDAGTNYGCATGEPDFEKWMKQENL